MVQNGVHAFGVTSSRLPRDKFGLKTGIFNRKWTRMDTNGDVFFEKSVSSKEILTQRRKDAKQRAALQKLLRGLASWRETVFGSETSRNGSRRRKRVRKGRFRAVLGRFSMKNRDFRPENRKSGIFNHGWTRIDTDGDVFL